MKFRTIGLFLGCNMFLPVVFRTFFSLLSSFLRIIQLIGMLGPCFFLSPFLFFLSFYLFLKYSLDAELNFNASYRYEKYVLSCD